MQDQDPDRSLWTIERLNHEPWVDLPGERELAHWGKAEEIRYNQGNRQAEKMLMFRQVFDFLKENEISGDYHEYGCHRCRTFRMALTEARRHNLGKMKFWAFDSFEGLPLPAETTSVSGWQQGALETAEEDFLGLVRSHGIYVDRVSTVRGYYDHSLTQELQQDFLRREEQISLVTIDCDLYESAVPVFAFIDPLLQEGSVIYIDDLFAGNRGSPARGVARAFIEHQARSRWRFVRHLDVGWWGRTYVTYAAETDGVSSL